MPKVLPLRAREIEAILARAGFVFDRQSGYRVWFKGERCTPVPAHPGDTHAASDDEFGEDQWWCGCFKSIARRG
jgi:predicted RNA binding protein YcfA (HicA-like mRNA interferase family)